MKLECGVSLTPQDSPPSPLDSMPGSVSPWVLTTTATHSSEAPSVRDDCLGDCSNLDDEGQVRMLLRRLHDYDAMADNLKAARRVGVELLKENQQLKRDKARLCGVIEKLLGFVAEEANEETIAFIMEKVKSP